MKYQLSENKDEIVRVSDGKVVAKIDGGEVKPTAPVYWKAIGELRQVIADDGRFGEATELVETPAGTAPDIPEDTDQEVSSSGFEDVESDLAEEQPSPEEVAEMIEEVNERPASYDTTFDEELAKVLRAMQTKNDYGNDPEPAKDIRWGWRTPGFPSWLVRNNRAEADRQYQGMNVKEYEAAIKISTN